MSDKPKEFVRENKCPHCSYYCDCATAPFEGGGPKPGDGCVCLQCTQVSVFGEDLALRLPTPEECQEFSADLQIARVQVAIEATRRLQSKRSHPRGGAA